MNSKHIGDYRDELMDEGFSLYTVRLSDMRKAMRAVLRKNGTRDMSVFDTENYNWEQWGKRRMTPDIQATYIANGFIVVQGDITDPKTLWLVDGFTRLFKLTIDAPVFVKVYRKDMPVAKIMKLLLQLNYWKTIKGRDDYKPTNMMIDRGLTLYTYMRTGINMAKSRTNRCSLSSNFVNIMTKYFDYLKPEEGYSPGMGNLDLISHDRFFDDIVLLHKLHGILLPSGRTVYNETDDLRYPPIDFYSVIARKRAEYIRDGHGDKEINVDIDHLKNWMEGDKKFMKKYPVYFTKYNSTGKINAMSDICDYFVEKYFKPVMLGEEGELTEEEKKNAYRNELSKLKRGYSRIKNMIELSKGQNVWLFDSNYPSPVITNKWIYRGLREDKFEYTPGCGIDKTPEIRSRWYHVFEMENGETTEFHDNFDLTTHWGFHIEKPKKK